MRRSEVIYLSIKRHRHVGGILDVNRELVKCGNVKILMAEVLRGQCISTGVTTVADIRKLTKVTALHRCNEVCLQHGVGNRMTSLSPHL